MNNNGDGNGNKLMKINQRFNLFKDRQEDMYSRYMERLPSMREKQAQDENHAKQFIKVQPQTANNKSNSKNKQYGSSNKMSNSNASNDQQSNTANNNKSGNFSNGPQNQQDLLQVSVLILTIFFILNIVTFVYYYSLQTANIAKIASILSS